MKDRTNSELDTIGDMKPSTTSPFRIGLTGGIGTGKSTVLAILKKHHVPVISADEIVHQLYETDTDLRNAIRHTFGERCITDEGGVNRKELGAVIFQDSAKRKQLEDMTHGRVREAVAQFFQSHADAGLAVAEIPLLFESGTPEQIAASYDAIWLVAASEDSQLQRLTSQRHMKLDEALLRLKSQMPLTDKIPRSHAVIHNNGSLADLEQQVLHLLREMNTLSL